MVILYIFPCDRTLSRVRVAFITHRIDWPGKEQPSVIEIGPINGRQLLAQSIEKVWNIYQVFTIYQAVYKVLFTLVILFTILETTL